MQMMVTQRPITTKISEQEILQNRTIFPMYIFVVFLLFFLFLTESGTSHFQFVGKIYCCPNASVSQRGFTSLHHEKPDTNLLGLRCTKQQRIGTTEFSQRDHYSRIVILHEYSVFSRFQLTDLQLLKFTRIFHTVVYK